MRLSGGQRYANGGHGPYDARAERPPHPRRLLAADAVFDTMIVTHIARANRCQMLRTAFAARAHIPDRVRGEIMGLASADTRLEALYRPVWFAEVHRLDAAGRQRASDRQVAWHGRAVIEADPSKDRGEAECHELASQNPGFVVVSQDSNAINHGRIAGRPVFAIPDVLLVFAAQGLCLAESAWRIYEEIVEADPRAESRFWPLGDPGTDSRSTFLAVAATLP